MKFYWYSLVLVLGLNSLASAADKPNIVLILVDDLGYGDLTSFGAKDLRTPNIDALMSRGMRLSLIHI